MKLNGIILVNKEKGISSNSVVNKVKHLLNADKAGHLGTLDVLGEGLLPVTLGKGTKLFDYFLGKDKIYRTIFKFGVTSDTLDTEGEITEEDKNIEISKDDIIKILPKLIGKQLQLPPIYSAKKINGQKAYDLARQGKTDLSLRPKEIEIYSIDIKSKVDKNTFEFVIHCSSGTYIRSIARDMASLFSTYGIMLYIQRTKCGNFDIKNSYTLEDIKNGKYEIIKLDSIFSSLDDLELNEQEASKLLNGVNIDFNKDGEFRAYNNGEYLGNVIVADGKMAFKLRLI